MPLNVMDAHYRSFAKLVVPELVKHNIGILGMKSMANGSILRSNTVTAIECLHYALNLPTSVGQWDGCNGIVISSYDEVAVNTTAKLVGASWCHQGSASALLARLNTDELLRRYAAGERNFANANLRCAVLGDEKLSQCNLTYVKLNFANLSRINFSGVDLTSADLSDASLNGANLSQASLYRTLLIRTNLSEANLRGANLFKASLNDACLHRADLTGANLMNADLRGAILDEATLNGANLTGAKFTQGQLQRFPL